MDVRLTVAVLAALVLIAWIRTARQPVGAVAVLLAVVPAVSGTARGLFVPGLRLSEFLVAVLVAAVLVLPRNSRAALSGWALPAIAAYAAASVLLVIVNVATAMEHARLSMEVVAPVQFLLIAWLGYQVSSHDAGRVVLVRAVLFTSVAPALLAIAQKLGVGPVAQVTATLTGNDKALAPESWQVFRSTGTFFSWHALGAYLALCLLLGAAIYFRGQWSIVSRQQLLIIVGLDLVALATSLTATTVLIVAVGTALLAWRAGRLNQYGGASLMLGGLALIWVMPEIEARLEAQESQRGGIGPTWLPQTIRFRLWVWDDYFIPAIRESPWYGSGRDVPVHSGFDFPESMYILVLMRGGLVLLGILLLALFLVWRAARRAASGPLPGAGTVVAETAVVAIPALLVAQLLHPYLADAGGAHLFFLIAGSVAAYAARSRDVLPAAPAPVERVAA